MNEKCPHCGGEWMASEDIGAQRVWRCCNCNADLKTQSLVPSVQSTWSEVEAVCVPAVRVQPLPTPNDHPAIWPLVVADMQERDRVGRERYGTPLQAHNGRDALVDLYQELLDAVVYLRQVIEERKDERAERIARAFEEASG